MNIVITGASSGIGLRTAEKLKELGNNVINVSLAPCGVAGIVDILADFAEADAARKAVDEAFERLGTVDVAIWCAGYSIAGSILDVTDEDIERITAVNYLSAVKFCRACAERMTGGKIILLSSMAGYIPLAYEHYYCATKAALISYARVAGMEFKHAPIQFCCITPSGVATEFSRNRKKVYGTHENNNLNAAISSITDMEQSGILADKVADHIVALLSKPKLPTLSTVTFRDKMILLGASLIPSAWEDGIMARAMGQRKPKLTRVQEQTRPVQLPQIIDMMDQSKPRDPNEGYKDLGIDPAEYGYTDDYKDRPYH